MEQETSRSVYSRDSPHFDGGDGDEDDESGSLATLESTYEFLGHVGKGSFGVVRCAQNKKTGEIVAIKTYRQRSDNGISSSAVREISLLKELHHPNIIRIRGVHIQDLELAMILECYDADLTRYMRHTGREGMTLNHIKSFLHQLLSGLEHCHSHRIIHRDLKPRNLLINHHGKLCITDFGLSKSFIAPFQQGSPKVATLNYRAPELLLSNEGYTLAIDLWSVGCIFAEMMLLVPLFRSRESIGLIIKIFSILGTPDESSWPGVSDLTHYSMEFPKWRKKDLEKHITGLSPGLEMNELGIDLLERFFIYSPSQRISAKKALEHPYFYDTYDMLIF